MQSVMLSQGQITSECDAVHDKLTHTHIYMHMHVLVLENTHTHTYTHKRMRTCIQLHTQKHTHAHTPHTHACLDAWWTVICTDAIGRHALNVHDFKPTVLYMVMIQWSGTLQPTQGLCETQKILYCFHFKCMHMPKHGWIYRDSHTSMCTYTGERIFWWLSCKENCSRFWTAMSKV